MALLGYQKALIKQMHDQCIYQKTIFVIIPFVQKTKFLLENNENGSRGFDIKPQYYWNAALLALLGFGVLFSLMFTFLLEEYTLLPIGIVCVGLLAWRIVELKKSNKKETFVREQFYQSLGAALMPEWLLKATFDKFFLLLQKDYRKNHNASDWQNTVKIANPSDAKFSLAFCLTYMENIIKKDKASNKRLIEKFYKSPKKERT